MGNYTIFGSSEQCQFSNTEWIKHCKMSQPIKDISENLILLILKFQEKYQQEFTQHRLKYFKLRCLNVPKT